MSKIIELNNLTKTFGSLLALDQATLSVKKGEKISIIGPSGSGKSTLLRCINQLEKTDRGTITIDTIPTVKEDSHGKSHPTDRKTLRQGQDKLGMVFQHFHLFPHMTVMENLIEAPILVKKMPKDRALHKAADLLDKVGLSDKRDAYPSQLSGGQKQRVAIARALAMDPEVLLCDEPTSALDPELVGEVLSVLKDLAGEKMTMILVTHEMAFARQISDRVIFMDQGRIIADEPPEVLFDAPPHPRIKEFLDKML